MGNLPHRNPVEVAVDAIIELLIIALALAHFGAAALLVAGRRRG